MPRMRAMDAAFLAMERRDEPRHLGTVMIFDPGRDGPLTHAAVRDLVARRLGRLPSARRVVVDAPLGLGRPSWEEERVDLDVHIRHVTVPSGDDGGMAALAEAVAAVHARRLDRRRPLWELHVVDGLADDRVALYAKVHLAALDDETGVDLMTGLLDEDRSGAATIEPADAFADGAADPTDLYERFVAPVPDQLRRAAGFPGRLVGRATRAVGEQLPGLTETAAEFVRRTPGLDAVERFLPAAGDGADGDEHPTGRAPRLSFNAPIGPERTVAFATLATDDIRGLAHDAGASSNEVVLGVCTGAVAALAAGPRRAADVAGGGDRPGAGRPRRPAAGRTSPGSRSPCRRTWPIRPPASPASATCWRRPSGARRRRRRPCSRMWPCSPRPSSPPPPTGCSTRCRTAGSSARRSTSP